MTVNRLFGLGAPLSLAEIFSDIYNLDHEHGYYKI
jgi:hypothetical protein